MQTMLTKFEHKLERYALENRGLIMSAARWADELHTNQVRASGEPFFIHPLLVAEILVDMKMDHECVIAALLHDTVEDTGINLEDIKNRFGPTIAELVDGVTKISILKSKSKSTQQADTIRKMLFAMTKDIRVIIIKLADKLHNMSTLEHLPASKRKRIATECMDIYAPLADRLGIYWLKAELEDYALKHLNPETYTYIKEYVTTKKSERSNYLKKVERTIYKAAAEEDINVRVFTRAKHFYSIYQKMKNRKKDIEGVYDILGIRILCNTTNDCYTVLGLVHRLWPPIAGRFKDYIAMPKANYYQSLHTTVMGFEGKLTEIQIRTHEMNSTAEYGVAAHWGYKQQSTGKRTPANEISLINRLKKWNSQTNDNTDSFLDDIKGELLKDSIYVFTPKGHIVELTKNSTAIDFAYHIHTEVGNRCIGAKADGVIIPLSQPLKNTQVIEIMTARNATPHVNWLRYVKTSRARQKIRHWLNKHDENLFIDKNIIAKKQKAEQKAQLQAKEESKERPKEQPLDEESHVVKEVMDPSKVGFKIGDEKNMMISIAKCCTPTTGDKIIGYVSRGRGIIVHRKNCPNLKHIKDFDSRCMTVEWETVSPKDTQKFQVTSKMTSDLFSEIEGAVRKYKGHLIEGRLEENEHGNLQGRFTMELEHKDDFKKVLKNIRAIPSVLNIRQDK